LSALVAVIAACAGGWLLFASRFTVMPAVVGLDEPAAQRLLTDADLVAVVTQQHHDIDAVGTVSATSPAPGTELSRGARVTVTVSSGRPIVPAIALGASVEEARSLLRAADLAPAGVAPGRRASTAPAGTVLGTIPPAGTTVPIAAPVTLLLSAGPAPHPTRAGAASRLSRHHGATAWSPFGVLGELFPH
jgi:serine/threonine-protein kinase